MTDITQVAGTTDAGTATPQAPTSTENTSAQGAQTETPAQPTYVTKEELAQTTAEIIRRVQQSGKDRMKQIATELQSMKSRLEATGMQLTPQQEATLRDKIASDLDPDEQAEAPASAITPEMRVQADFVFSQIEEAFVDAGMRVTANDPEWKAIQDVLDDPKGSLAKVIRAAGKAAETKAERVSSQKSTAAARVGGGTTQATGDALTPQTTGHDLFQRAHRK